MVSTTAGTRRSVLMWLPAAVLALPAPAVAPAQIPDSFDNLKILPGDMAKDDLVALMRSYASGLGVRCSHCHVGPDNLQGMDFASDEKETKRTARAMMRMVKAINEQYLAKLERDQPVELQVKCATCHRRQAMPRFIEDVVAQVIESDGVAAAVARYRELRDEYYGGYVYDFSAPPMSGLGERLAAAGKTAEALAILEMNTEYNPDASWNRVLTAQVLFQDGRREEAVAVLEEALEREPDSRFIKGQLARMKEAMAEQAEAP